MTEPIHDAHRSASTLPLAGITVVELGHSVAAPFAGQILGDLGARVVKVEKPAGDDARKWGPPFWEGTSALFQALNRNKASLALDLRDDAVRTALIDFIVAEADVVLQNMRPGQTAELGLDGPSLIGRKPALVYCNMGAFGARGPMARRPGYDPLMQAFGGIMSVVGEEGRPPVRVGPSIIDMGTGLWAVIGIVSALHRRTSTGAGGVVDVSLLETATSWMSLPAAQYMASGELPRREGSGAKGIVPYRAYATADGHLVIAAGNDTLFKGLAGVLGHPEWSTDPRFASNPDRVKHAEVLYPLIEAAVATYRRADLIRALDQAGIPCAPVQNLEQMLEDEQVRSLEILQRLPGTGIDILGLPISFDGTRPAPREKPPGLGEDNDILEPYLARRG